MPSLPQEVDMAFAPLILRPVAGVARNSLEESSRGSAQHTTAQHGVARFGTAWYSTVRCGVAQHGMTQHSTVQHSAAQQGMAQDTDMSGSVLLCPCPTLAQWPPHAHALLPVDGRAAASVLCRGDVQVQSRPAMASPKAAPTPTHAPLPCLLSLPHSRSCRLPCSSSEYGPAQA